MLYLNQTVVYSDDYTIIFDESSSVDLYLQLYMYAHTEFDSCYINILYIFLRSR